MMDGSWIAVVSGLGRRCDSWMVGLGLGTRLGKLGYMLVMESSYHETSCVVN